MFCGAISGMESRKGWRIGSMMESGSGRVGARGSPMARPGRGRPGRRHVGATLAAAAMIVFAVEAHAQLRPLDPLTWSVFAEDRTLIAQVGAAVYDGQRASLAGVEGRLAELGEFSVAWRTGRVVLEAAGTILDRKSTRLNSSHVKISYA